MTSLKPFRISPTRISCHASNRRGYLPDRTKNGLTCNGRNFGVIMRMQGTVLCPVLCLEQPFKGPGGRGLEAAQGPQGRGPLLPTVGGRGLGPRLGAGAGLTGLVLKEV